jgi:hypothetical protein
VDVAVLLVVQLLRDAVVNASANALKNASVPNHAA